MSSSNSDDLIMDGAQLSCQITVGLGENIRMFHVDAYPTKHTREITNNQKEEIHPGVNAVKQCRWFTVGVIQFYINPETRLIYKVPKEFTGLEITLKHCFVEIIKEKLAERAKELYGLEFTSANFEICPFKKFIAQLTIPLDRTNKKTYFGTLLNPRQLSPIRIIFFVDDSEALSEISLKLKEPSKHNIVLDYEYSLSGITTAHASLIINAEQVKNIDLEQQVFGQSKAEQMLVSRSYLEKVAVKVSSRLTVIETIGIGGSSFGPDLIKQEIANAIAANAFQKYSIEDVQAMKNSGILISEDLKADKITSMTEKKEQQSKKSYQDSNASSMGRSSEHLTQKSSKEDEKDRISDKSSRKIGGKADLKIIKPISIEGNYDTSSEHSSDRERSNSSSEQHQEKKSYESSEQNANSGGNEASSATECQVQGEIRQVKNIEAAIIHRNEIRSGFTISMARWVQHLSEKCEKGTLTTEDDIETLENIERKQTQSIPKNDNKTQEDRERKQTQERENLKAKQDATISKTSQRTQIFNNAVPLFIKRKVNTKKLHYKPRVVIMGRTGVGKTTLLNKLCGTNHPSGAGSGSITQNLFRNDVKCGDNAFILIDTPGTDSSTEPLKHAILLRTALTTSEINTIFIIVKYESRFDKMRDNYLEVEKPVLKYGNQVVLMVSHWDCCKEPNVDCPKIYRAFEDAYPYISNVICYSENSSNAQIANLMYSCLSNMNPITIEISDEYFNLYFNVAETKSQLQEYFRNYTEKTNSLHQEFLNIVQSVLRHPPDEHDDIYHMLIVQHKNKMDALLDEFKNAYGSKMIEMDYFVFYIELQKRTVEICDKFSATVRPLMSYSLFDNEDPRNLIKRCPHCHLIWFKTEGCDGATTCGARGFEKNDVTDGQPIWKYVIEQINGKIVMMLNQARSNPYSPPGISSFQRGIDPLNTPSRFFTVLSPRLHQNNAYSNPRKSESPYQTRNLVTSEPVGCGQKIIWSELPKLEESLILELFKAKTIEQAKEFIRSGHFRNAQRNYENNIDLTFHS